MPSSNDPKTVVQPGPGRLPANTVPTGALVTPGGSNSGAALEAHITDPTDAHDASAISQTGYTGNYWSVAASDVQDALDQIMPGINSRAVFVVDLNGANPDKDFASLETALTTLTANGDTGSTIFLKAGTYDITSAIDNFNIVGEDNTSVIRNNGGALTIISQARLFNVSLTSTVGITLTDDCYIRSCSLQAAVTVTGSGATLENITSAPSIDASAASQVSLRGIQCPVVLGSDSTLNNLEVTSLVADGIILDVQGSRNVINNVFTGAGLLVGPLFTSTIVNVAATASDTVINNLTILTSHDATFPSHVLVDGPRTKITNYTLSGVTGTSLAALDATSLSMGSSFENITLTNVTNSGTGALISVAGWGSSVRNVVLDQLTDPDLIIYVSSASSVDNVMMDPNTNSTGMNSYIIDMDYASSASNLYWFSSGLAACAVNFKIARAGEGCSLSNIWMDSIDLANVTSPQLIYLDWSASCTNAYFSDFFNGTLGSTHFFNMTSFGSKVDNVYLDFCEVGGDFFSVGSSANTGSIRNVFCGFGSIANRAISISILAGDETFVVDNVVFDSMDTVQEGVTILGDHVLLTNCHIQIDTGAGLPLLLANNIEAGACRDSTLWQDTDAVVVRATNAGFLFDRCRIRSGATNQGGVYQLFYGWGRIVNDNVEHPLVVRDCDMQFERSNCEASLGVGNGSPVIFFGGSGDAVSVNHGPYVVDGLRVYPESPISALHKDSIIAFSGGESESCSVRGLTVDIREENWTSSGSGRGVSAPSAAVIEFIGNNDGSTPRGFASDIRLINFRSGGLADLRYGVFAEGWDINKLVVEGPSSGVNGGGSYSRPLVRVDWCTLRSFDICQTQSIKASGYLESDDSFISDGHIRVNDAAVSGLYFLDLGRSTLKSVDIDVAESGAFTTFVNVGFSTTIEGCTLTVDTTTDPTSVMQASNNTRMSNNYFTGTSTPSYILQLFSSGDIKIDYNRFDMGTTVRALDVTTLVNNVDILYNIFEGPDTSEAIMVASGARYASVIGNSFKDSNYGSSLPASNGAIQFEGQYSVISGNKFNQSNANFTGIYFDITASSSICSQNTVVNATGKASIIIDGQECPVVGNTVRASGGDADVIVGSQDNSAVANIVLATGGGTGHVTVSAPSASSANVVS